MGDKLPLYNLKVKVVATKKPMVCSHQVAIAHVAMKYIMKQPGVVSTIIGVSDSRHIETNRRISPFKLDHAEMAGIRSFLQLYPNLEGEPFELERTPGSKFRNIMKMNLNEKLNGRRILTFEVREQTREGLSDAPA